MVASIVSIRVMFGLVALCCFVIAYQIITNSMRVRYEDDYQEVHENYGLVGFLFFIAGWVCMLLTL